MAWASDIYPGELVYEPRPDMDVFMIIWRTKEHGDFFRGFVSRYDRVVEGEK